MSAVMELFQDLFFTISFSLLLSLLLAKFFSVAPDKDNCLSSSEDVLSGEVDETKSAVCDFEKQDSKKVKYFEERAIIFDKIDKDTLLRKVEDATLGERYMEMNVCEGEARKCECENENEERESVGGNVFAEPLFDKSSERSKSSEIEVEPIIKGDVIGVVDGKAEGLFDNNDDDWEEVERTELEKVFWSAVAFLGSNNINAGRFSLISNEVKMQLYGLHKVATEGPCCKPQPMAIKVSARANWNAWKRVGNISPDEVMEQNIALLSRHVPDWMGDEFSENGKLAFLAAGTTGILPSYLEIPGSEIVSAVTQTIKKITLKNLSQIKVDPNVINRTYNEVHFYAGCSSHPWQLLLVAYRIGNRRLTRR